MSVSTSDVLEVLNSKKDIINTLIDNTISNSVEIVKDGLRTRSVSRNEQNTENLTYDDYDDILTRIRKIYKSCTSEEQKYLKTILEEIVNFGYSQTYQDIWLADYKEIPVDIHTFICDDRYLGKTNRNGEAVYPFWHKTLEEIFREGNKYEECFFTGATRIGKSSTAITATAYMLYKLMCLRDPQQFFGKKDVSIFSILFFNITKDMAAGVAYREFNDTLRMSPWFNEHGTFSKSERNFYYIPEGGKVVIDYGSDAAHGLGKQVFVGFMDELNFARAGIKDVNKAKEHMQDLYNTIADRVKGTFRMEGEVYGKIFAVSSKRSDSDFMEMYIQNQLQAGAGDHIYVSDAPQWEVLPPSMFRKEKFYIAVGDRYKKGFVVSDTVASNKESLDKLESEGYKLLTPPIDMKSQFLADFDIALRDLAGISVPGALSFITQMQVSQCIGVRQNPFLVEILEIGTDDRLTIEEFFDINKIDKKYFSMKHFIHLDLSLSGDKTGISDVCISGRKDVKDKDGKVVSMPSFTHIFSVSLKAPRGSQIPFDKITTFLVWLRKQGINIYDGISRDQYQSEYIAQLLEAKGLGKVPKISLDRTPDGYMAFRSVLSEKRIDMLDVEQLQNELIHLQRDSFSGKVDHPVGGAKDMADSMAGAVWNAILKNPGVPIKGTSVASAISSVNRPRTSAKNSVPAMFPGLTNNRNNTRRY